MQLWVKPDERKPDPAPIVTDDRKPTLVGLALWLVALAVALTTSEPWSTGLLWTSSIGILLGLVGYLYTQLRRR